MTNLNAFFQLIGKGADLSEDEASAILEFNGIDPSSDWDPNNGCGLYGAALGYLDQDNVGITQISEGGYSISYDRTNKAKYLDRLANDSGCPDLIKKYRSRPVLTSLSGRW